jgi:hypothetical protein
LFEKWTSAALPAEKVELTHRQRQARDLETREREFRTRLAGLPPVDAGALRRLQKLQESSGTARAALEAMAAGLEVLAADQPVTAGGTPLGIGERRIFPKSEVTVGARSASGSFRAAVPALPRPGNRHQPTSGPSWIDRAWPTSMRLPGRGGTHRLEGESRRIEGERRACRLTR